MPDDRYSDEEPSRGRQRDDDYERGGYEDDVELRRGGDIPNYLVQSILVTLCCCLPFGIVAIVYAAKVSSLVQAGDYQAAVTASNEAKKWCIIGLICGLISNAVVFGLQIMIAVAGH